MVYEQPKVKTSINCNEVNTMICKTCKNDNAITHECECCHAVFCVGCYSNHGDMRLMRRIQAKESLGYEISKYEKREIEMMIKRRSFGIW